MLLQSIFLPIPRSLGFFPTTTAKMNESIWSCLALSYLIEPDLYILSTNGSSFFLGYLLFLALFDLSMKFSASCLVHFLSLLSNLPFLVCFLMISTLSILMHRVFLIHPIYFMHCFCLVNLVSCAYVVFPVYPVYRSDLILPVFHPVFVLCFSYLYFPTYLPISLICRQSLCARQQCCKESGHTNL